jgi:hypothetical protein
MVIVEITGPELERFLRLVDEVRPIETLRVSVDDGLKVKIDGGMWSSPIGKVHCPANDATEE